MSFHVGQKVVCVDASPAKEFGYRDLVLNQVYVIEGFDPEAETGLYLAGVPRRSPRFTFWKYPYGWAAQRFRPIIERKTDTGMAILKKIAADVSKTRELVRGAD